MKIKLLHDNILLVPHSPEEKKKSFIIIPEGANKDKPEMAKVVSLGKDIDSEELGLNVGDTVIYTRYQPAEVKLDGVDYLIAKPEDILAKII